MSPIARLQATVDAMRDEMPERYTPRRESEQRFAQHEDLIAQVSDNVRETANLLQQLKLTLPVEYTQRSDFQQLVGRVNELERDLSKTITAAISDQLAQERSKHVRLSDRAWAVIVVAIGSCASLLAGILITKL